MTRQAAKGAIAPRSVAKAERGAAKRRTVKPTPSVKILETRVFRGPNYFSSDTAIRLGRALGTSPDFWLGLQVRHDLEAAAMAGVGADVEPIAA